MQGIINAAGGGRQLGEPQLATFSPGTLWWYPVRDNLTPRSHMNHPRMPRPTQSPHLAPYPIDALQTSLIRFVRDEAAVRREYPWAERFVLGLPLAPWQRGLKWSEEQSRRFITSAWTGVHLGAYVLTEPELEEGGEVRYRRLANCVLDGQQRLNALQMYLLDQLAVPDRAGTLTLWSELDAVEQRWFGRRIFERGITPLGEEARLRELHDLMNFGGVPHEERERALPPAAPPPVSRVAPAKGARP